MVKPVKCDNNTESRYAPKNEPNTSKLKFSGVLKHFCRNLTKNFSWRSKHWPSQKEAKNYTESYFLRVRKVTNPQDRFWFIKNDILGQNCGTGQILTKTVLLLKMGHMQLN